MPKSLIFKLLGAFSFVIVLGAALMFWLVSQATRSAFNIYTSRSGQMLAQRAAPLFADFYLQANSWRGIDLFIESNLTSNLAANPGANHGAGQGNGLGRMAGTGLLNAAGQRFILSDAQGVVINDTNGELVGTKLTSDQLKAGTSVVVDNKVVGTLIIAAADFANPASPAGQFIASVNQSILLAVAVAGIIALLLGAVLFFQITAPLRLLNKAAFAIAHGQLDQRVNIQSHDELGELGGAFNHMAESLERAQTQRKRMIADIAHELRTPLAVIQVNLEGMMDGVLPFNKEQLALTRDETLLLGRLVGDLRLLSLAEAGELKLERRPEQIGTIINQVVERLAPQTRLKQITLESSIAPQLPDLWVDSDRVGQVLGNLINNSIRYTPPGGSITLQAKMGNSSRNFVTVSVFDTGKGVDANDLPYIFDRFYRAEKARDRASGGSGLGLAIARQLVEAHGGSIRAFSPVFVDAFGQGYGTEVLFDLPVTVHPIS